MKKKHHASTMPPHAVAEHVAKHVSDGREGGYMVP